MLSKDVQEVQVIWFIRATCMSPLSFFQNYLVENNRRGFYLIFTISSKIQFDIYKTVDTYFSIKVNCDKIICLFCRYA